MASFTPSVRAAESTAKTAYPYVFISGYGGWGQYDKINSSIHYWGGLHYSLLAYLNGQGFECATASVDPIGSAWDRTCELYAQLSGTVVDYGAVHAARYHHARFGADYSSNPLFTGWGTQEGSGVKKVNFICHSFGGAAARLLAELMANGDEEEATGNPGDVSPLFTGGKAQWVNSITAISSPHNGTTATEMAVPLFKLLGMAGVKDNDRSIPVTPFGIIEHMLKLGRVFAKGMGPDTGLYDLSLDGAAALNRRISTLENVYYFSLPVDGTVDSLFGDCRVPDIKIPELMVWPSELFMGVYTGVTVGGLVIDGSWLCNDGVVNTQSCTAPLNAPQQAYDAGQIVPGVWHVMETVRGVHFTMVNGGFTYIVDIKPFFIEHMSLIDLL